MARPRPLLLSRRVGCSRATYSRSKTWGRSAAGMPLPSSSTVTIPCPPARPTVTTTDCRAYLSAFSIRLPMICESRSGSARTMTVPSYSHRRVNPRVCAAGTKPELSERARSARSMGAIENEKPFVCNLARSNRSATKRSSRLASLRITSAACWGSAAVSMIASA